MKLRRKKTHPFRAPRAVVLLALLPYLFAAVPAAQAAPDAECAAGRHRYAETRRVAATAMEDGEVTYLCSACGQQYTEILYATNHLWGPWVIDKQPSCTQPGEKHRTCTRTFRHDEYAEMPASGHDYAASVTTEPGCETEGLETFACSRCGDEYTRPIPPIGHDYQETIAKEPSCLLPGLRDFRCANDPAHTYEEGIPPLGGHSFGEWTVEIPAGKDAEGLEARVCARDGFKETRPLAALPARPAPFPVLDVVLISANVGFTGFFCALLIPYFICLRYIKKRREATERCEALRKEAQDRYGFQ